MIPAGYEFQSEFVRTHFNKALQEGLAKGRIQIVLKQLTARYGALPPSIKARINNASTTQLEDIAERLLTAPTLEEALGTP